MHLCCRLKRALSEVLYIAYALAVVSDVCPPDMDLVDGGDMGKQEWGCSMKGSNPGAKAQSCALTDQDTVPQDLSRAAW